MLTENRSTSPEFNSEHQSSHGAGLIRVLEQFLQNTVQKYKNALKITK